MLGVAALDGRLELDDAAPQLGRHLVRLQLVVEDVELPAQTRIRHGLARLTDGGERLGVGEEVRARELGLDAPPLGLLARVDVRVPPGAVGGDRQRPQPALELGDDPLCAQWTLRSAGRSR
jgi:hypothetical protein